MHHATGLPTGRKSSDTHLPPAPVYAGPAAEPTGSGNPEKRQAQCVRVHFSLPRLLPMRLLLPVVISGQGGAFYHTVLLHSG